MLLLATLPASCSTLLATAHSSLRPNARPLSLKMAATTGERAIEGPLAVLRRCSATSDQQPTPWQATEALAIVANAGVHPVISATGVVTQQPAGQMTGAQPPAAWLPVLSTSAWRPIFSAKPDALKAAAADGRGRTTARRHDGTARTVTRPPSVTDAKPGRLLRVDARQSFTPDERVENSVRLWRGVASLSFCGAFEMRGRRMSIRMPHSTQTPQAVADPRQARHSRA